MTSSRDIFYQDVLRPLLFKLDPERAHDLVHSLLRSGGALLSSLPYRYTGSDLKTEIAGTTFDNPVGLAAGFDKNGQLVSVLKNIGFGFAEVGSITACPSPGNPRPRLFRLPEDQALINRLGLNGQGAQSVAQRLEQSRFSLPVAVNVAKTHDPAIVGDAAVADVLTSFKAVQHLRLAYVAVNVSCPNTREGCLRERAQLADIVSEIQRVNERRVPLFVKVSPDSTDLFIDDLLAVSADYDLAGFICGNTTVSREGLRTSDARIAQIGAGGLSGTPLTKLALDLCQKIARKKAAHQYVIACGGISSGQDAYRFIRSGASAVELYTGLIYAGPSLPKRICEELSALLQADKLSLKQAIGVDLK